MPFASSPARHTKAQAVSERRKDLQLPTAGTYNAGSHSWVKLRSAGWVKLKSAPTVLAAIGDIERFSRETLIYWRGGMAYACLFGLPYREIEMSQRSFA